MSDYDSAQMRDRCVFGAGGARYCSRLKEAKKRIAEYEWLYAELLSIVDDKQMCINAKYRRIDELIRDRVIKRMNDE